jgi:FKBP-type peptidyl-prolyl cis-trans isomerase
VDTVGERAEPMREGGIRLVVVPSDLAYGTGGLSRYHAWKL